MSKWAPDYQKESSMLVRLLKEHLLIAFIAYVHVCSIHSHVYIVSGVCACTCMCAHMHVDPRVDLECLAQSLSLPTLFIEAGSLTQSGVLPFDLIHLVKPASWLTGGICLHPLRVLGLQRGLSFYVGAGDPNLSTHASVASTLSSKASPLILSSVCYSGIYASEDKVCNVL